ncbi:signal peptidase I [Desulfogranum japonicum]|uniref:signal peptidase I n=1 Tax=Desulfogranum japonicum TaxID=231447 RepID=UPI00040ABDC7|nr:signal peptidase I [Desulfogranum japonicum]
MKSKATSTLRTLIKGWGCSLLVALLLTTSFKSAIADWNDVPTGSMKPTILEGDRIFVNKLAYDLKVPYTTLHIAHWDDPARGDIVVFFSPADGTRLVKRVIGIPGDTITMENNQLLINGKKIAYHSSDLPPNIERYADASVTTYQYIEELARHPHPITITPDIRSLRSFGPIAVPESTYFMMGDNRDNSADSRYFGFVHRDLIVGQATAVVGSLDINNRFTPRWNRFFTNLQ